MKFYDKILIIIYAVIYALIYVVSNVAFEMTSENFGSRDKLWLYLLSLLPVAYYSMKYIGPGKGQTYFMILLGGALIWVTVLYTVNKTRLLYYAARQAPVTTVLKITKVNKQKVKNSFEGSEIYFDYDNRNIELQSSRINFFAFQHQKNFKVDIGKAGDNNYYISKIYWQPGELSAARAMYWQYWLHGMRYVVFFIVGIIALVPIILHFKKISDSKSPAVAQTKGGAIMLIFKIAGAVFVLFLVAYLCLLVYLYFRYGHIA